MTKKKDPTTPYICYEAEADHQTCRTLLSVSEYKLKVKGDCWLYGFIALRLRSLRLSKYVSSFTAALKTF